MLKKLLLAGAAVLSLAGAAQAQSIDPCGKPDLSIGQRVICSSPRLKANLLRNREIGLPLLRQQIKSPAEYIALMQNSARSLNKEMAYCRVPSDRMPALPLDNATEDCLAGWQDISYAKLQR